MLSYIFRKNCNTLIYSIFVLFFCHELFNITTNDIDANALIVMAMIITIPMTLAAMRIIILLPLKLMSMASGQDLEIIKLKRD